MLHAAQALQTAKTHKAQSSKTRAFHIQISVSFLKKKYFSTLNCSLLCNFSKNRLNIFISNKINILIRLKQNNKIATQKILRMKTVMLFAVVMLSMNAFAADVQETASLLDDLGFGTTATFAATSTGEDFNKDQSNPAPVDEMGKCRCSSPPCTDPCDDTKSSSDGCSDRGACFNGTCYYYYEKSSKPRERGCTNGKGFSSFQGESYGPIRCSKDCSDHGSCKDVGKCERHSSIANAFDVLLPQTVCSPFFSIHVLFFSMF